MQKCHYRELEHSLMVHIYEKTAKVIIYLRKERSGRNEVVNHFLLRLLPSVDAPLYCFELMLCKKTEIKLKKIVREYNC